jgi:hypothetical protein
VVKIALQISILIPIPNLIQIPIPISILIPNLILILNPIRIQFLILIPIPFLFHTFTIRYDFKSPLVECANKLAQILLGLSNLTGGDGKMMMQHSSRAVGTNRDAGGLVPQHFLAFPAPFEKSGKRMMQK